MNQNLDEWTSCPSPLLIDMQQNKTAGQPQLFLCPLVTLCGHWMWQPHFLIWIFISGMELGLTAEFSTPAPFTPAALHCSSCPSPHCLLRSLPGSRSPLSWLQWNSFCICQRAIESQNVRAERTFESQMQSPSIVSPTLSSYNWSIDAHWTSALGDTRCWVLVTVVSKLRGHLPRVTVGSPPCCMSRCPYNLW